ncbi:MAG TPA: response regulator [Vicinamibacterales bacterium]|nr:response regulator [Vicinamibacterales bacterium]
MPTPQPSPPDPVTVLVVDDEDAACRLVSRILIGRSYRVLSTTSPAEALEIAADSSQAIDVLLTDVRMPSMSGPELAARLVELRPSVAVMYMSGFSRDVLPSHLQHSDVPLVQKPFAPHALSRSIAETLRRGSEPLSRLEVAGGASESPA